MLSDETRAELVRIHQEAFKGRRKIMPWSYEDIRFLSLSLCGEAGEAANCIKKEWRGDERPNLSSDKELHEELADVAAYLALLVHALGIDLDEIIINKLPEIRAKFHADVQAD